MKIKNESLAKRCEICHQSDCFVAKLNHCSRCNGAKETAQVNVMANRKTPRRIFSDAFWRKINGSTEPGDYLTPYNWFLAQEAKANLVTKERKVKNWWSSNEVIIELVVVPVFWMLVSAICIASFYVVTKDSFFTLLTIGVAVVIHLSMIIGTATKLFLRKRQETRILEAEKINTDNYISTLLYEE